MPTTRADLAVRALDALNSMGIQFALLHGEERIVGGGEMSDVDLAVDRLPEELLTLTCPKLTVAGLHLIAVWTYDVGAATLFLVSPDASDGLQLDLAWDPRGQGKRGTRFGAVVDGRVQGRRWHVAQPIDELLYLVRKRQEKRQLDELGALVQKLREHSRDDVQSRMRKVLTPRAASAVTRLLEQGPNAVPYRREPAHLFRTGLRYLKRLGHPTGFWVELSAAHSSQKTEAAAQELCRRFGRILPHAEAIERPSTPGPLQWRWGLSRVAPIRWRPGLVVSWGRPSRRGPVPDLTLRDPEQSNDALARAVVAAMEQRCLRRYGIAR